MFGKNKTQGSTAFNMPPLLLLLSLLCAPVPIFASLTPYSFRSPLQPPWFLHYFQQLLPVGLTFCQVLYSCYCPGISPSLVAGKSLSQAPSTSSCLSSSSASRHFFFYFSRLSLRLIFLSSDSKLLST